MRFDTDLTSSATLASRQRPQGGSARPELGVRSAAGHEHQWQPWPGRPGYQFCTWCPAFREASVSPHGTIAEPSHMRSVSDGKPIANAKQEPSTLLRLVRCTVQNRFRDPCTGEAVDPVGEILLCPRHLAAAVELLRALGFTVLPPADGR